MRFLGMGGVAAIVVLACTSVAQADERKFTYSYEAKTLPQGSFEFEQWATLRARREMGRVWFADFREELEYGVTDRLTVAGYLNWGIESIRNIPGVENETEVEFETFSLEVKYKITDPSADFLGLLGYIEGAVGSDEQELEFKIVLSKQLGPVTLAYNFVVEFEREKEDGEWEKESALEHTFGASMELSHGFAVGAEAVVRMPYEGNFEEKEETGVLVGPNVHYASKGWWVTVTFLVLTGKPEEFEKYEARIIFGVNF
jgi:hypothetical protein